MKESSLKSDSHWLKSRENIFNTYIPDIRQMAREQGDEVADWSTINQNRHDFLAALPKGSDILVFAYGSLMWKPLLRFNEQYPALLKGYQRRFCLNMTYFRGSPEIPGLMMALDTGVQCEGLCYRIPAHLVEEEMHILWTRECCLDGYNPVWIQPEITPSIDVPCMTFIINHDCHRYIDSLPVEQAAERIRTATGQFGNNRDYFDNTLQHLREMGIYDEELESLDQALRKNQKA